MTATEPDIDDAFERVGRAVDPSDLPRPDIQNGYYTMVFPCGSHRVFRIHTQQKGKFSGKRLLGMLIGPDNTSDYENFSFLDQDGFQVWKRFQKQKQAEYAEKLFVMITGGEIEGHELTESRRCRVCNRTLTTPESYRDGIGPTCRTKGGRK